jgi:hypothetical protein
MRQQDFKFRPATEHQKTGADVGFAGHRANLL